MITIPMWVFITLSILAAIGGMAILMVIFAHIRVRIYENKKDLDIAKEMDKIWDTKTNKEN